MLDKELDKLELDRVEWESELELLTEAEEELLKVVIVPDVVDAEELMCVKDDREPDPVDTDAELLLTIEVDGVFDRLLEDSDDDSIDEEDPIEDDDTGTDEVGELLEFKVETVEDDKPIEYDVDREDVDDGLVVIVLERPDEYGLLED